MSDINPKLYKFCLLLVCRNYPKCKKYKGLKEKNYKYYFLLTRCGIYLIRSLNPKDPKKFIKHLRIIGPFLEELYKEFNSVQAREIINKWAKLFGRNKKIAVLIINRYIQGISLLAKFFYKHGKTPFYKSENNIDEDITNILEGFTEVFSSLTPQINDENLEIVSRYSKNYDSKSPSNLISMIEEIDSEILSELDNSEKYLENLGLNELNTDKISDTINKFFSVVLTNELFDAIKENNKFYLIKFYKLLKNISPTLRDLPKETRKFVFFSLINLIRQYINTTGHPSIARSKFKELCKNMLYYYVSGKITKEQIIRNTYNLKNYGWMIPLIDFYEYL